MPKTSRANKVFSQRRVRFLGELVDTIFTAMPALSVFSLVSTTIILYEVTKQYLLNYAPWMNVLYFIAFLAVAFIPIMLIVYKFIIPSVWHFRSTQMSHLENKIDSLSKKLDELLKEKDASNSSE